MMTYVNSQHWPWKENDSVWFTKGNKHYPKKKSFLVLFLLCEQKCVYRVNAWKGRSFTFIPCVSQNVYICDSFIHPAVGRPRLHSSCKWHPEPVVKQERHSETEGEVKKESVSGIIGVSGASSFSDVILCKHCLLQDARTALQLHLLFSFFPTCKKVACLMLLKPNCHLRCARFEHMAAHNQLKVMFSKHTCSSF